MKKILLHIKILTVYVTYALIISGSLAFAQSTPQNNTTSLSRDELTSQIQEKGKQLETIDKQLQSTRESLKNTKGERVTLQKELNTLSGNINQLNLSLKSDEINIQKLSLEIESLGYDLEDIKHSLQNKRNAIEKILLELQKNYRQNNNLLAIFLRNSSLADGVLEAQTLKNLQSQLVDDVESLRNVQDEYNQNIQRANSKKSSVASHKRDSENKKLIVQDQQKERATLLIQTKNKESIYTQQVTSLVKLQQQIATEIEGIESIFRKNIDPATLPRPRPGVLEWPVPGGIISQGYGRTDFAIKTYQGKFHNGIDIAGVPIGSQILAAESGTVINVGNQDLICPRVGYGKFIVVKHGNGLTTLYAHLSGYIVTIGKRVERGDVIGYLGRTGWATGPHLHFTVFATNTISPAIPGAREGTKYTKLCGPMPVGGDLDPRQYLTLP